MVPSNTGHHLHLGPVQISHLFAGFPLQLLRIPFSVHSCSLNGLCSLPALPLPLKYPANSDLLGSVYRNGNYQIQTGNCFSLHHICTLLALHICDHDCQFDINCFSLIKTFFSVPVSHSSVGLHSLSDCGSCLLCIGFLGVGVDSGAFRYKINHIL